MRPTVGIISESLRRTTTVCYLTPASGRAASGGPAADRVAVAAAVRGDGPHKPAAVVAVEAAGVARVVGHRHAARAVSTGERRLALGRRRVVLPLQREDEVAAVAADAARKARPAVLALVQAQRREDGRRLVVEQARRQRALHASVKHGRRRAAPEPCARPCSAKMARRAGEEVVDLRQVSRSQRAELCVHDVRRRRVGRRELRRQRIRPAEGS